MLEGLTWPTQSIVYAVHNGKYLLRGGQRSMVHVWLLWLPHAQTLLYGCVHIIACVVVIGKYMIRPLFPWSKFMVEGGACLCCCTYVRCVSSYAVILLVFTGQPRRDTEHTGQQHRRRGLIELNNVDRYHPG